LAADNLRERLIVGAAGRLHRADFHVITVVTKGAIEREVDFVRSTATPETVVWIRPGQVQRFLKEDGEGLHILFTVDFAASLPASQGISPIVGPEIRLSAQTTNLVHSLAAVLYSEPRPDASSAMVRQLVLRSILSYLSDPEREGTTHFRPLLERFRIAVEAHFHDRWQVEDYARELNCSVRTLSRAAHAGLRRTPKEIIDERTALEAKRLLGYTDLPAARIATQLGFAEPANFGRFFRRMTGTSTQTFRAEISRYRADARRVARESIPPRYL
jgi:AraC-like DNA-binding protein